MNHCLAKHDHNKLTEWCQFITKNICIHKIMQSMTNQIFTFFLYDSRCEELGDGEKDSVGAILCFSSVGQKIFSSSYGDEYQDDYADDNDNDEDGENHEHYDDIDDDMITMTMVIMTSKFVLYLCRSEYFLM